MASLIEDLLNILQEQLNNLQDLLGLSEEKKDVIIQNNLEQLQFINGLENTLISRNNKFEKSIAQLTADIAMVLNLNQNDINFTALSAALNSPEKEQMAELTDRMTLVANKLKEVNEQNRVLIDHSLDYINFTVNLYSSASEQEPTYTSQDQTQPGASKFFDFKQ